MPKPNSTPTARVKPNSRRGAGGSTRASDSTTNKHRVNPRKITSNSIVERPETLNFQSKSEPKVNRAARHATWESNNFLAMKKVSATATNRRNWLKMAIKNSG